MERFFARKRSVALLRQCVYPRPLDAPIAWGHHYEAIAIQQYMAHMTKLGHSNIMVKKCGFIIHPEKGRLGASPDGKVKDPVSDQPDGIIEVKCPYSKCEVTPEEIVMFVVN